MHEKMVVSEVATGGVLQKKVFLKFTKFTGKLLCQSLFFNKVEGLRLEIFKNTFFTEQIRTTASVVYN